MMENWQKWLFGGGFIVVWGITLAFLDWRASVHAATALSNAGIVPEPTITAMQDDIGDNKQDIRTIEDRWNALVDAIAAQQSN